MQEWRCYKREKVLVKNFLLFFSPLRQKKETSTVHEDLLGKKTWSKLQSGQNSKTGHLCPYSTAWLRKKKQSAWLPLTALNRSMQQVKKQQYFLGNVGIEYFWRISGFQEGWLFHEPWMVTEAERAWVADSQTAARKKGKTNQDGNKIQVP